MRVSTAVYVTLGVCVALGLTVSDSASAQVPRAEAQPRVEVPARGAALEPAAPGQAAAPVEQPPAQPTTAPAAVVSPAPAVGAPAALAPMPASAAPAGPAAQPLASPAGSSKSATSGFFAGKLLALALDGVQIEPLESAEGGFALSGVAIEQPGPGNISPKHLSAPRYEEITLTSSLGSKALADWIAASWRANPVARNGSLVSMDLNRNVLGELEFKNAFIIETAFPALRFGGKDNAQTTLKLAPEYTHPKPVSGVTGPNLSGHRKMAGHVHFEMAGLDGTKVTKIDSFTVRRAVPNNSVADPRNSETKPGVIEFPDLRITLSASGAQTWVSWHDDFVVKGNNGPDNERSGAIVYVDVNQIEVLRITLSSCGIFKLTPQQEMKPPSPQSMPGMVQSIVAELYCERMDFVGK